MNVRSSRTVVRHTDIGIWKKKDFGGKYVARD